jgi:hypothetical protein
VPRRKNFAESFNKRDFHPVKQGFSDETTYSQTQRMKKRLLHFSRAG